ncbi:thioesterase domain-containing protein [Colletotrichum graminicola]|uniref:Thioesterase domain-containing protein n=1 Tax=Colletotrichum graminicola (strain M1.001 / M2 / FGSC 10212) TaxID=645133 RepID=E3Q4J4_COLGM|nr:thioesterase domain-containing protein [Colletotrichum graminicola M1.001]EFQ26009.1 thioesterase domain-containing protein [Colletotrichum graminicola M1.001]WDK23137.1 thioesterase domain-containing protein [Colletotrichum graminicola]
MLYHPAPKECELVQPASPRGETQMPLILVHDGGGTTFAYHCLGPLDRAVFGIANPRFHSGVPWDGGLPEMAATYLRMIRATVTKGRDYPAQAPRSPPPPRSSRGGGGKPRRRILLGGWSLGGMLSLEIARQLGDEDEDIEIAGLVIVDSVYPVWPEGLRVKIGRLVDGPEPETKNLRLARRAMGMAGGMVRAWKIPRCGAAAAAAAAVTVPRMAGGGDVDDRENHGDGDHGGLDTGFYGSKREKETAEVVWERPPRAVLVKAKARVPSSTAGVISSVDVYREDEKLGWDGYCPGFVERVLMTEGHHFDMFDWGHIDGITEKIFEACRVLERAG